MKSVSNFLIAILMIMYWVFRIVVAYMYQTGRSFVVEPINFTEEIIVLFITLVCIILVIARNSWGGIIYVVTNFVYYGPNLLQSITGVASSKSVNVNSADNLMFSGMAIILSLVVLLDLIISHTKKPDDVKTSWFYNNSNLDKKVDSREDKNHYKLY